MLGGIMTEEMVEIGLLFGSNQVDLNSSEDWEDSESFLCLSQMKLILKNLLESVDIKYLSDVFKVSPYFLLILTKENEKTGQCLICDTYYSDLFQHFSAVHKLQPPLFNDYLSQFSQQAESYWPFKPLPQKPKSYNFYSNYRSSFSSQSLKTRVKLLLKHQKQISARRRSHSERQANCEKPGKNAKSEHLNIDFKNILDLDTAKVPRNSDETYMCDQCNKEVKLSRKKSHVYSHNRNKCTTCNVCGVSIKMRHLNRHRAVCSS